MKKHVRVKDWDRRLAAVTARHLNTPSEWGASDCIMKVAEAVEAVIGEDMARLYRGKYSTEIGAAKILRKKGCANVEELLAKKFKPVGRLMAQRGDVVSIDTQDGQVAAGYVTEYGVAVATPSGIVFHPQTSPAIRKAFKVGR